MQSRGTGRGYPGRRKGGATSPTPGRGRIERVAARLAAGGARTNCPDSECTSCPGTDLAPMPSGQGGEGTHREPTTATQPEARRSQGPIASGPLHYPRSQCIPAPVPSSAICIPSAALQTSCRATIADRRAPQASWVRVRVLGTEYLNLYSTRRILNGLPPTAPREEESGDRGCLKNQWLVIRTPNFGASAATEDHGVERAEAGRADKSTKYKHRALGTSHAIYLSHPQPAKTSRVGGSPMHDLL